jgi:hypothetical protein
MLMAPLAIMTVDTELGCFGRWFNPSVVVSVSGQLLRPGTAMKGSK